MPLKTGIPVLQGGEDVKPEEWAELRAMLVDEIAFSMVPGAPSCADIGHTLSP